MSLWFYECKAFTRRILRNASDLFPRSSKPSKNHRVRFLSQLDIDVVFDVGANNGQYARQIQSDGYRKRIVSFEPLTSAFAKLRANARGNRQWQIANIALGDDDTTDHINISGNSQSSSLLSISPQLTDAAPGLAYIATEEIEVRRVDSVIDDYCNSSNRLFLKLDVQGYETHVLRGAAQSLDRFLGVQLEMSTAPLYDGEGSFIETIQFMSDQGFELASLANVWADPRTMRLMQIDGIFLRLDSVAASRAKAA